MIANKPKKLPIELDYQVFVNELGEASEELGRLDGRQRELLNSDLIITPLTAKEATTSSKIEGTQSTVSDVMSYEAGAQAKYNDTPVVANYRRAMNMATPALEHRTLSQSLMRELHSVLLENSEGHDYRGVYRDEQVFIGPDGATIEEASYIPPEPLFVQEYMDNWEHYLLEGVGRPLLKAGILHYQFEAIHPFKDGNGRIGRLIIPLYLHQVGALKHPILYISGYFDKHRNEYIQALHHVDLTQRYEQWLKFFFRAITEQSKETQRLIESIKNLRTRTDERAIAMRSPYTQKVVEMLFIKPIFTPADLGSHLGLKENRHTPLRLANKLTELGIVRRLGTDRRPLYAFEELIMLL